MGVLLGSLLFLPFAYLYLKFLSPFLIERRRLLLVEELLGAEEENTPKKKSKKRTKPVSNIRAACIASNVGKEERKAIDDILLLGSIQNGKNEPGKVTSKASSQISRKTNTRNSDKEESRNHSEFKRRLIATAAHERAAPEASMNAISSLYIPLSSPEAVKRQIQYATNVEQLIKSRHNLKEKQRSEIDYQQVISELSNQLETSSKEILSLKHALKQCNSSDPLSGSENKKVAELKLAFASEMELERCTRLEQQNQLTRMGEILSEKEMLLNSVESERRELLAMVKLIKTRLEMELIELSKSQTYSKMLQQSRDEAYQENANFSALNHDMTIKIAALQKQLTRFQNLDFSLIWTRAMIGEEFDSKLSDLRVVIPIISKAFINIRKDYLRLKKTDHLSPEISSEKQPVLSSSQPSLLILETTDASVGTGSDCWPEARQALFKLSKELTATEDKLAYKSLDCAIAAFIMNTASQTAVIRDEKLSELAQVGVSKEESRQLYHEKMQNNFGSSNNFMLHYESPPASNSFSLSSSKSKSDDYLLILTGGPQETLDIKN